MTSSLLLDTPEVLAPMSSVWGIRDMETLIIPGDRWREPGVAAPEMELRGITMVGTRSVRRRWAVRPAGERTEPSSPEQRAVRHVPRDKGDTCADSQAGTVGTRVTCYIIMTGWDHANITAITELQWVTRRVNCHFRCVLYFAGCQFQQW